MARRLSMTGEVVDASRAERIGLVTEVVAHDQLLSRTLALAAQICEVPSTTMLGLKEIYVRGAAAVLGPALAAEGDIAGSQKRDFAGLDERFGNVSARNRSQIGGQPQVARLRNCAPTAAGWSERRKRAAVVDHAIHAHPHDRRIDDVPIAAIRVVFAVAVSGLT